MGSKNSKEKELNEDLERIRKERIARERAERDRAEATRSAAIMAQKDHVIKEQTYEELQEELHGLQKSSMNIISEMDIISEMNIISEMVKVNVDTRETLNRQIEQTEGDRADKERADKERAAKEAEIRAKNIDIIEAADEGRIADVKLVLQHAPERVNDQDPDGATALHYATVNNSFQVAAVLVAAKANVDIKTNDGLTALQIANNFNNFNKSTIPRFKTGSSNPAIITLLSSQDEERRANATSVNADQPEVAVTTTFKAVPGNLKAVPKSWLKQT